MHQGNKDEDAPFKGWELVQSMAWLCAMNLMLHSIETDKKPASETPWTKKLWSYDLRTNRHFTLKTNSLHRSDLDELVACYFGLNGSKTNPLSVPPLPRGEFIRSPAAQGSVVREETRRP